MHYCLDLVAADWDSGVVGEELIRDADGAGQGATRFFLEPGRRRL
jgi:hypothetical protein